MKQGSFSTSQAFQSCIWTCRNGSCVSSVIYFCFIVLSTGGKTTTRYHKILTHESDLFVFLEFSVRTCSGRIYGALWWLFPLSGSGRALAAVYLLAWSWFCLNAHTHSAAVHQLIRPQLKETNSPSALCFSGVSDSVSQTWAWILWEFFSCFCQPVSHFNLRPRSSLLLLFLALSLLWSALQTPFLFV